MHCGIASRVTKLPATLGRVVVAQSAVMQHWVRGGHRSSVETISRTSVSSTSPAPRAPAAAGPIVPATPQPLSPATQAPPAGSVRVNAWAKVGSAAPALNTSRDTRSMAVRMFCCRSASSGSRRKAFPPEVRRP